MLAEAGYRGEKVVVLMPGDYPMLTAAATAGFSATPTLLKLGAPTLPKLKLAMGGTKE